MALNATLQNIVDISRRIIPDRKTKTNFVKEEIGFTDAADKSNETFYTKNVPLATPVAYIDVYKYTGVPTLNSQTATAKVFLWDSPSQSLKFGNGTNGFDPPNGKVVFAEYSHVENLDYYFSDEDIGELIPQAINFINSVGGLEFTYSGVSPNYTVSVSDVSDKYLVALALGVISYGIYMSELERTGLGISFRGGLFSLHSTSQLREFRERKKDLSDKLMRVINEKKLDNTGAVNIELYTENEIDV